MTAGSASELGVQSAGRLSRERLVHLASIAFCGVLPAVILVAVLVTAIADDSDAIDFRPFYRAAQEILDGDNPYPGPDALLTASGHPWVYPPLPALLAMPLTLFPMWAACLIVMVSLVPVALAIPYVLGVSDWRCYGVILLWPPVISGIQTGNVTLWLALAAALGWRFRDRVGVASASVGSTLAVKFLLWPLVVWLGATRRWASALLAAGIGCVLLLGSWAVIGFDGMTGYPDLLRRLQDAVGDDAYTLANLLDDLGAPAGVARAVWVLAGLGVLAASVLVARRGDERSAFILALGAALALSPLVWLHYFALLITVVAVARRELGLVWFVPLAMVVSTGGGDPTPLQTFVTLGAAAATLGLAIRDSRSTVIAP